jgi:hypothetical protein
MNAKRKKRVAALIDTLTEAAAELKAIQKEENKARETSPTPKGETLDNSSNLLGTATTDLQRVLNGLGDITGK